MIAVKQGHKVLLEYLVGSEANTAYMWGWKKPILTRINIRHIRLNEPSKFDGRQDGFVDDLRNAFFQHKYVPPIHVVRIPISFGKYYGLIDGHHRLEAAKQAGLIYVDAVEMHHTDVTYGILEDME